MHPEAGGAEGAAAAAAPHAAPGAVLQREVPEEGAHQAGETSRRNQERLDTLTEISAGIQTSSSQGCTFFPFFVFTLIKGGLTERGDW